ncbi:MAG: M48 family metalloprotease [Candidatus Saliniplasma sp.]
MSKDDLFLDNDRKFEEVFSSLKEKGLIDKKRKLEAVEKIKPSLKMQFTKRNTILYRRDWREKWDLDEDAIKFVLLHEEAHLTKHRFEAKALATIIPITLYLFMLYLGTYMLDFLIQMSFESCCLPGFILIVIIILSFGLLKLSIVIGLKMIHPWAKRNETNCDLYAAKILRDRFGVEKPSRSAEKVLKPKDYYPPNALSQIKTLLFTIRIPYSLKILVDPHPHWKKRIEKIERVVDE